jgi:hypothetical protein
VLNRKFVAYWKLDASMKHFLQHADGWLRLAVVLSLLWFLGANLIYFSGVGETRCFLLARTWIRTDPHWETYWYYLSFGLDIARPYGVENTNSSGGALCSNQSYSPAGHLFFVFLPLIYIWVTYAAARWVSSGFAKASRNNG